MPVMQCQQMLSFQKMIIEIFQILVESTVTMGGKFYLYELKFIRTEEVFPFFF
jgi:hypothetical protein